MENTLDQNDVDALLAAVNSGDLEQEDDGGDVLIYSRRGTTAARNVDIRGYDFKRPERVSKDQMRALENLHQGFARAFGAQLSGFMRTIVEVKVAHIEHMTFSEFTHSLPNPTSFNLLSAEPLEGNICFELSPLIIFPIIDRLLGGSNADLFIPQRPLTTIEHGLVGKIIKRAERSLAEAWESILALNFKLTETESNPQLVQIVPPNEVVVVVGFEIKMSSRAGTASLCIPYNVIEPVVEKLSNQTWAAYKRGRGNTQLRTRVAGKLENARLSVTSVLAETNIKLSDLMNLQVGDVLTTDKPASAPLSLLIEGRRKFIGQLGQFRGKRAFKVTRPSTPKARV